MIHPESPLLPFLLSFSFASFINAYLFKHWKGVWSHLEKEWSSLDVWNACIHDNLKNANGGSKSCSLLWSRQLTIHVFDTFIYFSTQEEKCPPTGTATSHGTQAAAEVQSTLQSRCTVQLANKSPFIWLLEFNEGACTVSHMHIFVLNHSLTVGFALCNLSLILISFAFILC